MQNHGIGKGDREDGRDWVDGPSSGARTTLTPEGHSRVQTLWCPPSSSREDLPVVSPIPNLTVGLNESVRLSDRPTGPPSRLELGRPRPLGTGDGVRFVSLRTLRQSVPPSSPSSVTVHSTPLSTGPRRPTFPITRLGWVRCSSGCREPSSLWGRLTFRLRHGPCAPLSAVQFEVRPRLDP